MINGEYKDIPQVIGWIANDLARRFPGAEGEVFFETSAGPPVCAHKGTLTGLLPALSKYCQDFLGAWVSYQPEHPYGCALKVVGHGNGRIDECGKDHVADGRNRTALLVITRAAQTEILVGRHCPP